MCLKPITFPNPARRLNDNGASRLLVTVPCNDCVECYKRKQLEWSCRSYYEALDTFKVGGFIYFDTLTYDDEHLPHVSDFVDFIHNNSVELLSKYNFSCFNRKAPKLFFANLRERLKRSNIDVRNCLSFLLTSEYGESEDCTHRPHYHVLFFVKSRDVNPYDFSLFVHDAWFAGRTDGFPYQTKSYVDSHIFRSDICCNQSDMLNVINYVSKYVSKDSVFKFEVQRRIEFLLDMFHGEDNDFEDYKRSVIRSIKPFIRASVGFGSNFLEYNKLEDIERTGKIWMPDSEKVKVSVPIPMYLKRKLWYDLVRDVDGSLAWKLNAAGKAHNRCYAKQLFDNSYQEFHDWYLNLDTYLSFQPSLIDKVHKILDNRLKDYVEYILYYRGRLLSTSNLAAKRDKQPLYIPSVEEQIVNELYDDNNWFWSYLTKRAKRHFGTRFLTYQYSGTSSLSFTKSIDKETGEAEFYDLPPKYREISRMSYFVYNQSSTPKWRGFDSVYNIYVESLRNLAVKHDQSILDTKKYNDRMKRIYRPLKLFNYV